MKVAVALFAVLGVAFAVERKVDILDADAGICLAYEDDEVTPWWKSGAVPDEPAKFLTFAVDSDIPAATMPCPAGTVFSVEVCICDHDPNYVAPDPGSPSSAPTRNEVMCFDFENTPSIQWGFNTIQGQWVGNNNGQVSLVDGPTGKAAIFNGAARLDEYFYAGNYRTSTGGFAVEMSFNRDTGSTGDMYLFTNDRCYYDWNANAGMPLASFEAVSHADGSVTASVNTFDETSGNTEQGTVTVAGFDLGAWHELTVTYENENGGTLTVYLDGASAGTAQLIGGKLYDHWCPLEFGRDFKGLIDNVCGLRDAYVAKTK